MCAYVVDVSHAGPVTLILDRLLARQGMHWVFSFRIYIYTRTADRLYKLVRCVDFSCAIALPRSIFEMRWHAINIYTGKKMNTSAIYVYILNTLQHRQPVA